MTTQNGNGEKGQLTKTFENGVSQICLDLDRGAINSPETLVKRFEEISNSVPQESVILALSQLTVRAANQAVAAKASRWNINPAIH